MSEKRPHILVVVNVFSPDLGGGVLFSDMCQGFLERGFQVTVKCAYSYYPEWKDKSGKNGLRIEDSIENGLRVERHGLYLPSNPNSFIRRLVHEGSFFLSLLRRRPEQGKYDVILVVCPLIGAVAYAIIAGARSRAPVWLNVQDLSAQAAIAGGFGKGTGGSKRLAGSLEHIQNSLFRRARYWSTISAPMKDVLAGIPGAPGHIHLIPNWLHRSLAQAIEKEKALSAHRPDQKHPPGTPVRLLYSGNIGGKQDLLSFCKLLSCSKESFFFRIQGEGARAGEIRSWIQQSQDARFEMASLADEADLAHQLALADYYVITERSATGNAFIPSKLIPGISSGTPVLAVCDSSSPLACETKAHQLGVLLNWEELKVRVDRNNLLRTTAEQYDELVQNCLARSRFYERESGIDRCEEMLRHILREAAPSG